MAIIQLEKSGQDAAQLRALLKELSKSEQMEAEEERLQKILEKGTGPLGQLGAAELTPRQAIQQKLQTHPAQAGVLPPKLVGYAATDALVTLLE